MIRPDPDTRREWAALAGMYRFLYGMSLQDRLAEQRFDVAAWYWIGGTLEVKAPTRRQRDLTAGSHTPVWPPRGSRRLAPSTAGESVAEPGEPGERASPNLGSPLSGRPDVVKEIVMRTSVQTGVPLWRIMSKRQRWAEVQARHLCVRRLAALPWCGDRPSHEQIAQWMNLERSTVTLIIGQGA